MKIGVIEAKFEIKNFSTFKEWMDNYEKEVIIPASKTIYPDTEESRRLINNMVTTINKTIFEKWKEYGCHIPEIKNVQIHASVKI